MRAFGTHRIHRPGQEPETKRRSHARTRRPERETFNVNDATARDRAKEEAGRYAASYVTDGMKVGLGTGSTVHWTIVELGERALDIVCTATSVQTHELATTLGLRVILSLIHISEPTRPY